MAREPQHPRAEPHIWPVATVGVILALQVVLMQITLNRLEAGEYASVFSPAVAILVLALASWLIYRQLDRERL